MILKYKHLLITSIIIILAVVVSSYTSLFKNLNDNIYDYYLQLNKSDTTNKQIVIVKIDEKTIKDLGPWPIDRSYYSELAKILFDNGAKVAGIYLEFSSPVGEDSDLTFITSLSKYPIVTLTPYTFNLKQPENEYWGKIKANVILSHDILSINQNEFVRNYSPVLNKTPSFSLAVLNAFNNKDFNYNKSENTVSLKHNIFNKAGQQSLSINFKTPFYDFKTYSLVDVLSGNYNEDAFKDKIVLVGITKERMIPFYKTPFSKKFSFSGKVPPLVIQAQIIDSILNDEYLNTPDTIILYLILVLYIPLLVTVLRKLSILRQIFILFSLSVIEILISFGVFSAITYWISPLLFLCANIYILIITSLITHFKVSNFLDTYIKELTGKKDNLSIDASVDNKLVTLKEITSLIEQDRDILDTILNSFKSAIVLFDENGEVVYSNNRVEQLPLNNLLKEVNFSEFKLIVDQDKNKDYRKYFNFNNLEIEFIANKARDNLYAGIFNDITEISQINETKSTIARMLSHELKTPLTSIILCCDVILGIKNKDKLDNYIYRIINQAEFIKEVISEFLELNKIEFAEFQLQKEKILLVDLFTSIIEGFKDLLDNKNITIKDNLDKFSSLQLNGDKKYLIIVFKNLIDNAIKYTNPDTEITIQCEELDNAVQISITDQGFGMQEEDLENLFKKFYRIKTSQTEEIQGTGLGLSFVKKIIDLHNATIDVKSEVNKGTTFIITLPKE